MTHLVIGMGEVGTAIKTILGADGYDFKMAPSKKEAVYDVVHICFPHSYMFVEQVRQYVKTYAADMVVVHSTVPVGTCDNNGWVHSPVRGIHPELEKGIRTFTKFFGGERAQEAAHIFREHGIKVMCTPTASDTEAMKLWDTTIYGWNILLEKAIKKFCMEHNLDFGIVYTLANITYNEGYELLAHPEYKKFVLKHRPGPVGGHCVRPNWELLDSPIAQISKDLHNRLTDI